jgi:hypothetical protein
MHNTILFSHKKNEILSFVTTQMELKVIKGVKRREPHNPTHMWNREKVDLTEVESRMMVPSVWGN